MHIKNIKLSGFRNLKEQSVDLQQGVNLLLGENGQGKTNFLEAIFFLATLRSFRSTSVREVIRFGEETAEVSGLVQRDDMPVELRVQLQGAARSLWVGQKSVRVARDFLGQLRVVAFTPDDLAMIKGGPALRRKFMDRSAFLFEPQHLVNVRDFNQALRSRNRLLKEGQGGKLKKEVVDSFSQAMAVSGTKVSRSRKTAVERVGKRAESIIRELVSESSGVDISYEPGWRMIDDGSTEELMRQLNEGLENDLRRGQTCRGPQQDDFMCLLGDSSARKFASQGQQRMIAIALLLSVVEEVVEEGGERPVILLDDVSSELDAGRRELLFERVGGLGGQILVTTTDEKMVPELAVEKNGRFRVTGGTIKKQGDD